MISGAKTKKLQNQSMPRGPRTFRRLMSYTRVAWHLLAALFSCIIIKSLLELAVPWVMGFMLFDGVIAKGNLSLLPSVVITLSAIFVAQKFFSFLQEYLNELTNQRIVHKLRCDLYEHIERLPLKFFDRHQTGDLQSRVTGDVDTADGLLKTLVEDLGSELIMFIGTISFLFAVNPNLTAFVLPTIPALALSVFFFKRTIKRVARLVRDLIGEMTSLASETISGVRVVKAFCGEKYEAERFADKSLELLRARVGIAKLQSIYSSTVDVWVFIGTIIVIWVAAPRITSGAFTVGALVAYLSYLNKLYGPAKKLSKINVSIQKIIAAGDRIFEVMDVAPEFEFEQESNGNRPAGHSKNPIRRSFGNGSTSRFMTLGLLERNGSGSASGNGHNGSEPKSLPTGSVRFDNVTFEYEGNRPVLKDFNLDAAPGEVISLVGHSGAGKTT